MKLRLRYFASIREALGRAEETVHTEAQSLGQLRDELLARGGVYAQALNRENVLRMAMDQVLADEETPLRDGAEVALFPPVTGG